MQDRFEYFMKKELVKYIDQELAKGHSLPHIREILLNKGHQRNLVEEAIVEVKRSNLKQEEVKPGFTLKKEMQTELHDSLVKYIKEQLHHGHHIKAIRAHLLNHGHSYDIITRAVNAVATEHAPKKKPSKKLLFPPRKQANVKDQLDLVVNLIVLLILIWIISLTTKEAIYVVGIGLLPCLLTVLVGPSMLDLSRPEHKNYILFLPFVFVILVFLLFALIPLPFFQYMNLRVLSVVNVILGILLGLFMVYVDKSPFLDKFV